MIMSNGIVLYLLAVPSLVVKSTSKGNAIGQSSVGSCTDTHTIATPSSSRTITVVVSIRMVASAEIR